MSDIIRGNFEPVMTEWARQNIKVHGIEATKSKMLEAGYHPSFIKALIKKSPAAIRMVALSAGPPKRCEQCSKLVQLEHMFIRTDGLYCNTCRALLIPTSEIDYLREANRRKYIAHRKARLRYGW